MTSETVLGWIEIVGLALDVAGVLAIVGGGIVAVSLYFRPRDPHSATYRGFRQNLGRAILLGLEVLVAADIIRTVAIEPTLVSVSVLGVIVLVRTLLSFSLEVELEGRWPWQRSREAKSGDKAVDRRGPPTDQEEPHAPDQHPQLR